MVKFGMANTLITFEDQYYEYGGDVEVDYKGLTIGGFESAFFADLVAAFILENTTNCFDNSAYNGIYRDDGIDIIKGRRTTDEMCDWLDDFQAKVNILTGSDHLQFTAEIWNPSAAENEEPRNKNVTIRTEQSFPYLDMELYWRENELNFRIHLKPNQQLKYLNKGSTHTNATFKAIPNGVLKRLANLTSANPETENKRLNELYPQHALALEKAQLTSASSENPTLKDSLEKITIKMQPIL